MDTPLAERVRPRSIDDFIGQAHVLGEGKTLRTMIESGNISSMILWGPPGTGKTTLARIIARSIEAAFYELSAISSGVKDIRDVIEKGNDKTFFAQKVILFIDEIHRFNKAQQDALLGSVETGKITLIGATTENPSFEVISPLLSRCQVFTLKSLTMDALNDILERALKQDRNFGSKKIKIEDENKGLLFAYAGGDARIMLNRLEIAINLSKSDANEEIIITEKIIKDVFEKQHLRYDKSGEEHYNIISAFIKSIRGSDPDAAVYWLARMLEGGEDPKFIARRLIIVASEDVGNAEPYAMTLAVNCFNAVNYIGMPEARIILSQVTTYLASCNKSNASYLAIEGAIEDAKRYQELPVPLHLRNAPTGFMKKEGYGQDYKYSHDYKGHFVEQQYLPDKIKNKIYYNPTDIGREKNLKEHLKNLWTKRRD